MTIIEIKNSDNLNVNYLELEEKLFEDNSELYYENKSIYILHYPNQGKASVSYGITKKIENGEINHLCSTQPGSSGSPILDLNNNKVIGIHKGSLKDKNINLGTLLRKPLEQFYKEMTIKTTDIREHMKKLVKLKKIEIYEKKLLDDCKLTPDMLDERGNKHPSDWPEPPQTRGGFDYYPPTKKWVGFGLKVWSQYDNGNNEWIAKDNNPNEWAVAYYGTSFEAVKPICQNNGKFFSSALRQMHKDNLNANKKSQNEYKKCGIGSYFSPNFGYVTDYSLGVIIMCRVNPNNLRIPSGPDEKNIWITDGTRNTVRPYRILFQLND